MKDYTFKTIAHVEAQQENEEFKSWLVTVKDEKGLQVTMKDGRDSFYLADGYVDNALTSKGIDRSYLEQSQVYTALKNATFTCSLIFKVKGETFVATASEGQVNTAPANKAPKWVKAVKGETYTYQESGIIPDWSELNHIEFTDKDFAMLEQAVKQAKMDAILLEARLAKINAES